MRSCDSCFVGMQRHPAAVEYVSAPLLWRYARKLAERLRGTLYVSFCAGKRGRVIHSRYESGADERCLQVTAGVQGELLHPRVGGERIQPLFSSCAYLSHGLLYITADSF